MKITRKQLRGIIREEILRAEREIIGESYGLGIPFGKITAPAAKALMELLVEYLRMRNAGVRHADKYFHCLGHCKAVRNGLVGLTVSELIGTWREEKDIEKKGDDPLAVAADYLANNIGRLSQLAEGDCGQCWRYIPNGLPEKYWIIPENIPINHARSIIKKNTEANVDFMARMGDEEKMWAAEDKVSLP